MVNYPQLFNIFKAERKHEIFSPSTIDGINQFNFIDIVQNTCRVFRWKLYLALYELIKTDCPLRRKREFLTVPPLYSNVALEHKGHKVLKSYIIFVGLTLYFSINKRDLNKMNSARITDFILLRSKGKRGFLPQEQSGQQLLRKQAQQDVHLQSHGSSCALLLHRSFP